MHNDIADFELKANDTSPALQATLTDESGTAIDLSGASVRFHMGPAGESSLTVDASASITDAANGVVEYAWASGDTETPDTYTAEFEVTYSDSTVESFPNDHDLIIIIHPDRG